MNTKYEIRHWQDNIYAVYEKNKHSVASQCLYSAIEDDYLFKGTLDEVNAWLSLQEKGFTI